MAIEIYDPLTYRSRVLPDAEAAQAIAQGWVQLSGGGGGGATDAVVAGLVAAGAQTRAALNAGWDAVLAPTSTKTAAYTVAAGELALMNVPSGATALTLPAAPPDKTRVGARAIGATTAVPLVLTAGGSDTIGDAGATTVTQPLAGEVTVLQYQAAATRWLAVANVKSMTSLDARYPVLPASGKLAASQLDTAGIAASSDLTGAYAQVWRANTAYAQGAVVVAPGGQLVSAKAAFTSGASYVASNWTAVLDAIYLKIADYSAGGGAGANAADVGYDLWLLWGQSNMAGRGTPFDTRLDPIDSRVWQFGNPTNVNAYASALAQAYEPLAGPSSPTGIGPGFGFARHYAASQPSNRRVILVPSAVGGSYLANATSGWKTTIVGGLYSQAITHAQAALAAAGPNARYAGILWHQGEADGGANTSGATYATELDTLIAKARTDLGVSNLPFVIGQLVPEYLSLGTRAAINTVHAATPSRVTRTAFVQAPIGMNLDDDNHFSAAGQRIFGRSYFDAYRRIITATADPALPTVPGTPGGLAAGVAATSITLTWTAPTGAAIYYVEYKTSASSTWTRTGTTTGLALTVTGLTSGTAYDFRVTALNNGGPGTAATVSATPTSGGDTTAPTISSFTATAGNTSVALAWAATDNVGVTRYVVARTVSGTTTTVYDGTGTSYSDTGLTNGVAASYVLTAYDAAGNTKTASASATPAAPSDTQAPTAPTNLAAGMVTSSSVPLTWTASTDNVGVTGYKVRRGGTVVGQPTATSFSDTGLAASTAYTYTVTAIDAAGNESAASNSVTATTSAASSAAVSDTFTRADSTTSLGTADSGQAWVAETGVFGILNGAAYNVSATNSVALIQSGLSDCTVKATAVDAPTTANTYPRMIFRATDKSNYWCIQQQANTSYRLFKVVAAAFTQVGSNFTGITPAAGDVIEAVCSGSTITIKINGTQYATTSDTHSQSGTRHGIGFNAAGNTAIRWDNVTVTA